MFRVEYLSICPHQHGRKQGFSAPLSHTLRYLIPTHTNTRRLNKATRDLTRIKDKSLVQKYFISQTEVVFQESELEAEDCTVHIVWVLELYCGDKAYVGFRDKNLHYVEDRCWMLITFIRDRTVYCIAMFTLKCDEKQSMIRVDLLKKKHSRIINR